jgi:hypothetical protein
MRGDCNALSGEPLAHFHDMSSNDLSACATFPSMVVNMEMCLKRETLFRAFVFVSLVTSHQKLKQPRATLVE